MSPAGQDPPETLQRDGDLRRRTYSWRDPALVYAAARKKSGLEFLQDMIDRKVPNAPIAQTLVFGPTEVEEGRAVFTLEPRELHCNPLGVVHGGVLSTLLDTAMACAIHTMLPAGVAYTTLELKVNFLRPVAADSGPLRCEGTLLHAGSRTGLAEGRILRSDGKLVAHGSTTCMILGSAQEPPSEQRE